MSQLELVADLRTTFIARMRALKPDFVPSALEITGDETLYISGPNTLAHKNYLSALGCKWSPSEKRWRYIRTEVPIKAEVALEGKAEVAPEGKAEVAPEGKAEVAPEVDIPATFLSEMRAIAPDFPFNKVTYELTDGVLNLSGEPTRTYRAFLKILKFRWNPATLKWYRNA